MDEAPDVVVRAAGGPGVGPGTPRALRAVMLAPVNRAAAHQYFPKGSDLRAHSPDDLTAVAAELNARPRMTLGWDAPAALLGL